MNCCLGLLFCAVFVASVQSSCVVHNSTDCQSAAHKLHCGLPGWHVGCVLGTHCVCLHNKICTTSTDCGRLNIINEHNVTVGYGCPSSGTWGCHHTPGHGGNCEKHQLELVAKGKKSMWIM